MRRPLIYVSGPMAGAPGSSYTENIRRGIDAAEALERLGAFPYLPHTNALWGILYPGKPYKVIIKRDLAFVEACHGFVRIPGESVGADEEDYAVRRGKAFFRVDFALGVKHSDITCRGWEPRGEDGSRLVKWISDFAHERIK